MFSAQRSHIVKDVQYSNKRALIGLTIIRVLIVMINYMRYFLICILL